jgi:membrane protease YdiL (CAAX protease family)
VDWGQELVLLLPVPAAVVANYGLRHDWARIVTYALVAAIGLLTAALALVDIAAPLSGTGPASAAQARSAPFPLAAGLLTLACLLPQVRQALARAVPLDPDSPVHLLALALTLTLFGSQLQGAFGNELTQEAGSAQSLSRIDLVAQEIPFLIVALAGVGLAVRRSGPDSVRRLGLVRPAWWHVVLALAAAGVFYALAVGIDQLGQVLTPGTARQVNSATNRIFGQLTADPAGVATIAITAGVCEEVLFRGALQPRLGILWTSLVFASVHTQYGLSFDALAVLVLAVGLGLIRKYVNTTSSIVCHTVYDAVAGAGLGGIAIAGGLALEGLLIVTLGATFGLRVRRARLERAGA